MYERLEAIEVEREDGTTEVFTVKRLITQDSQDPSAVFSNELIFRPGGGALARRVDNRVMSTADDSIADAHKRQREETDALRTRGLTQAKVGGEKGMQPDGDTPGDDEPGRRPRRGSRAAAVEE